MTRYKSLTILLCGFVIIVLGCNKPADSNTLAGKPAVVYFTMPIFKEVAENEEFTGRTEAERTVEVRARVSGYLDKVNFKDGSEVKQGEVLFEVDPRPYQAEFDRASAALAQAQAQIVRLDADFSRAQKLLASNSLSKEDYDKVVSDRDSAYAAVKLAKAVLDTAQLNLSFTKITASLAGLASKRTVDPGNLIKADDTLLTTIVSLDPMYASFDIDERTMLKVRRQIREGKLQSARVTEVPISIGLPDEEGYSTQGTINFVDNHVDASTGTLRVRGVFANPSRLYSPGVFVRVLLRTGPTRQAMVVPDEAIGTDQGQKYVYTANEKNVIQYRKVTTGTLAPGGLRVIEEGLSTSDRVIVTGLQRIRQGATVDPKPVEILKTLGLKNGPTGTTTSPTVPEKKSPPAK